MPNPIFKAGEKIVCPNIVCKSIIGEFKHDLCVGDRVDMSTVTAITQDIYPGHDAYCIFCEVKYMYAGCVHTESGWRPNNPELSY